MVDISKFEITELKFGERKSNYKPNLELYNFLKEDGIRKVVSDHYDLLVESEIRDLFPNSKELLDGAKKRSADFFIQRLGGPEYYKQSRGNPMLANRHLPFKITPKERIEWLNCYKIVLSKLESVPENIVLDFWRWIDEFSNWMVNHPEDSIYKVNFSL